MNTDVKSVYDGYPAKYRKPLLEIRQMIFDIAEKTAEVGPVEESLKWGQPAYTAKTGTPIRLDRFEDDKIALFVHCQTSLIETFRTLFPDQLTFSKTRAVVLNPEEKLPLNELSLFIEKALTYRLKKK